MADISQSQAHSSILVAGDHLKPINSSGTWSCPLCVDGIHISELSTLAHIEEAHDKKKVLYQGLHILKCHLHCGSLRQRNHYHCPVCVRVIISRGDFIFHLKGHDAKQGVKQPRGRKKTLAAVMQKEAGLENIQLFSHVSVVVAPHILSLIDNHDTFWRELEVASGVTCLVGDNSEFCVIEGRWDCVQKANTYLEQHVIDKLRQEMAAQQAPSETSVQNELSPPAVTISLDPTEPGSCAEPGLEGDDNSNLAVLASSDIRRSSRKRKFNSFLDEYVTPNGNRPAQAQESKLFSKAVSSVKKTSVAYTLRTTVQQECRVTLGKIVQTGDYTVQLHFPPAILTQPPEPVEPLPYGEDLAHNPDDNLLAGADDDDEDEDFELDEYQDDLASEDDTESRVVFSCTECSAEYPSTAQLSRHRSRYHMGADQTETVKSYKCLECDFATSYSQDLRLHNARNHLEKELECKECHEKFGPIIDLKYHIRKTGHNQGQFKYTVVECKICHKRLQYKNLKMHQQMVHDKVKPFKCDQCGKAFGTRYLVKEHQESHKAIDARDRPWKCNLCGQSFFKKLPLDEHMSKHDGKPQFQCSMCSKKFYHVSGYKRHLQHHSEERPFSCEVCGKSFKTSTNLSAHKQVHKPMTFLCICGKTYQQKHSMRAHQEKCPTNMEVLASQLAEEQYPSSQVQRYMCGFCQETFYDFEVVQQHVKQHVVDNGQIEGAALSDQSLQQALMVAVDENQSLEQLAMTAALEQQSIRLEGGSLLVTGIVQEGTEQL